MLPTISIPDPAQLARLVADARARQAAAIKANQDTEARAKEQNAADQKAAEVHAAQVASSKAQTDADTVRSTDFESRLQTRAPGGPGTFEDQLKRAADLREQFFSQQREAANAQANTNAQRQDDAITRRMAAIGQSGSGAAIGAKLEANNDIETQRRASLGQVNAQDAQSLLQQNHDQQAMSAQHTQQEHENQFQEKQYQFQEKQFQANEEARAREYELAKQQFELDKDTTAFNRRISELMLQQRDELAKRRKFQAFGSILGAGTGFAAGGPAGGELGAQAGAGWGDLMGGAFGGLL